MSDTNFVDYSTLIPASWLNDVNKAVYRALGAAGVAPTTAAQVLSNLGLSGTSGAGLVGTNDGNGNVQASLNAKVSSSALAAATGAGLVGTNDGWANAQASLNARPQRVALYSDLQAITPTNAALAPTATVMGRTSRTDGAFGIFDWMSGDQSANVTADTLQGLWVPPSADTTGASGAWKRRVSGPVDARCFGAQGVGASHDDTAAINAALTLCGAVWIQPTSSYYNITSPIAVGYQQRLLSAGGQIWQATDNVQIVTVSSSKWVLDGLDLRYTNAQGAGKTSAMGVDFSGAFEGQFTRSTITNAYQGFGVLSPTSFAYQCYFATIRTLDCYDYGVAFNVNGSIGLTTNTFDNVYVLQTSNTNSNTASKGFLLQYHTGGLVMRNCACDKIQGGLVLFIKGCTGPIVQSFYTEASVIKNGSGLVTIDSSFDVNIDGYVAKAVKASLGAGQTASFVRITGTTQSVRLGGRETGTDTTGNLGTIYGVDSNSSSSLVAVKAYDFVTDSSFVRNDALITGSYRQIVSYNQSVLQEEDSGKKIQYRTAAPTTGTWAQGDTIINSSPSTSSPVDAWRCIIAGTPGTWRPVSWTVLKGATAARPTLGASDFGVGYLDTTLAANGKPIWWQGSSWVDSTGTAV